MIKNAGAKETILKVNRSGRYFCTDRINLFVQFWFKFENKKHFKDQTVQLIRHFSKILKIISLVSGSFPCLSFTSLRGYQLLIACVPPHVNERVGS